MKEPTPTAEDTQLSLQATNTRIAVDHLSVYAKQNKILEERRADMQNL